MLNLTKTAFVMAPICLVISFITDYVLNMQTIKTVFIALATLFLVIALIGKAMEARKTPNKEDKEEV